MILNNEGFKRVGLLRLLIVGRIHRDIICVHIKFRRKPTFFVACVKKTKGKHFSDATHKLSFFVFVSMYKIEMYASNFCLDFFIYFKICLKHILKPGARAPMCQNATTVYKQILSPFGISI